MDSTANVVILSCNYEFIALTPPNSVDMLLDPTRRIAISKSDVLELLDVDEQAIFLGYTAGGCDDIAANLVGVGFHRALKLASKYPRGRHYLHTGLLMPILKAEFSQENIATLTSLATQIQVLQHSLWTLQPQQIPTFEVSDTQSMMQSFASEEDSLGNLRRESFFHLTEKVSHLTFHITSQFYSPSRETSSTSTSIDEIAQVCAFFYFLTIP